MNPRVSLFAALRPQVRTLRFRLAALNLLVFSVILSVLCVVVMAVRERRELFDFDDRLTDRAERMVESIHIKSATPGAASAPEANPPRLVPFRFPGYFFQVRAADGTLLERSLNLGRATLPFSLTAKAARTTGLPALETCSGEVARSLLGSDGEIRLLTLFHQAPGLTPFYLQVGCNLAPVRESVTELRRLFLMLIPLGLVAVGLASWLMARRSLAPIGRIARQARALTAAHLDRRISLPLGRDEVAEMVVTINEMLDRLEAAFLAQERFIADASHELKTPVTVLLGEAQVLTQHDRTPEEYRQFVDSVQDEMRQMGKLVDSLLTLARADAGFPLTAKMPVSLNEVVMDAVERCQVFARQRGVRLVPMLAMPVGEEAEPEIEGDAALLCAMAENLIRNALRYSPANEVVEVKVALDGTGAAISVSDRGPGIPPEHLDRVFERFYRVPGDRMADKGTGLGLAITKGVAKLHGGSITVANRTGCGCEFVIHLPLMAAEGEGGV
ncbi:MAG TPA: HAMP domain-containing sensor histidine kinase [Phycisphaerae bacterium]|nr:HAMP domain-containing sensor histidine kinase [Phycisphaerae bacterium]